MTDNKSELVNPSPPYANAEGSQISPASHPGNVPPILTQPAAIPPILLDRRWLQHGHYREKMPPEGRDLLRSGFALTSLSLGVLALAGCWVSMWSLVPAVLAMVFGPTGVFSHRRLLAIIGVGLGFFAIVITITQLSRNV
jgi:hypothetical protein